MATPSSSTTTPSPQLRYLQPHTPAAPTTASTASSNGSNPPDKEERDKAVQRFLARAEIGKLTRGLRTRLSYATFKAMHNLSHNTLRDLENDTQSPSRSAANRPGINHYNNPATQGNSAMLPASSSRTPARKGTMAPPPPVTASAAQSLFSSILAPPPAKRARTIHNPEDPPVPAPTKPKASTPPPPSSRKGGKRAAESAQPKPRGRKGKGKQKAVRASEGNVANMDIDMNAAATLTSFLISSRPSISASASSPRSSVSAGSDVGSTHSFAQQYAQSSARTVTAGSTLSSESSFTMPAARPSTPPSSVESGIRQSLSQQSSVRTESKGTPKTRKRSTYPAGESGTPHPPSDTEAADSLLFLATSPSPVRGTFAKDRSTKDSTSFRALRGSGLRGRVLFPGHGNDDDDRPSGGGRVIRRENTGSFASTLSAGSESSFGGSFSQFTDMPSTRPPPDVGIAQDGSNVKQLDVPIEPIITPPTPIEPAPTQLLPAPPSPGQVERLRVSHRSNSPERFTGSTSLSAVQSSDEKKLSDAPPTPGNGSFNLSDFIHVSPSPAAISGPLSRLGSVDIGRRLFEEHHGLNSGGVGANDVAASKSGLGAGIDLVKS